MLLTLVLTDRTVHVQKGACWLICLIFQHSFNFFLTFLWHCGHDMLYLKDFKDAVPVSHTGHK